MVQFFNWFQLVAVQKKSKRSPNFWLADQKAENAVLTSGHCFGRRPRQKAVSCFKTQLSHSSE